MKTNQSNMHRFKKSVRPAHAIRNTLLVALAGLGLQGQAKTVDQPMGFEAAFSDKGQPASLHFTSTFRSDGMEHKLEVWRLNDEHLKRVTDGALEVHVGRKSGDPEFRMTVLDLKKRLMTQIDRSNLYRIGNFTDWFDLAHGIRHPKGEYQLVKGKKLDGMPRAIDACDWFDLTQGHKTSHICWSTKNKLPLLVSAPDGQIVWQVSQLERKPISKKTFEIHDEGFIRNDANQDIEHD
jgi:hypothetical protein